MKRKSQLFLFQADHLSGEEIGYLIDQVHIWGAKNAHAIPTVTKKGRPGYILLVDLGDRQKTTLIKRMAIEFGLFGCHQIQTVHWLRWRPQGQKNLR